MNDLYALSKPELTAWLKEKGVASYRGDQLWQWMYEKGASSFVEMSNLPESLRTLLTQEACLGTLTPDIEQHSTDGTCKRLYRLHDGQQIESVLMPYRDNRRTACISSQAGCAMACQFCATGQMGFARHLTATEIFTQAMLFSRELQQSGERLSNVVLMGMGEPFHNYDAVLVAIRRLMSDLGIGARHITVSTVGIVPKIREFANEGLQVTLAISLHAATDEERSALLPINKRYPLKELMDACRFYAETTGRRISFEWALIHGKNDAPEVAHGLGRLLNGVPSHVNLIPLNPTPGFQGGPSEHDRANQFVAILESYRIPATLRVRRGIDIDAGCGQLKAKRLRASDG